jgi:hypothetical protein
MEFEFSLCYILPVNFLWSALDPQVGNYSHHQHSHKEVEGIHKMECCLIEWLIMSMGWDYISEPQPPTPPTVHPPGDMWAWRAMMMIMLAEENWFIHQSSLVKLPTESSGSKYEEWRKEWEFYLFSIWNTLSDLLHAIKSYDMGLLALLPIWRKVCCGFISPLKIHCLSRIWTCDPWIQCQAH